MFTGIVEDLGKVQSLQKGSHSARLRITSGLIVSDVKLGDSIAVNGICLTVTSFDSSGFTVDVMLETLKKTTLGELKPGQEVNLERALRLSDRLGGHLVSGHIDGVGTVIKRTEQDIAVVMRINYPPQLGKYLVPKGSVAIDGTSLTVVDVQPDSFSVSLIPHTRGITTLGHKQTGDTVNLEMDVVAKYLEKIVLTQRCENPEQTGATGGLNLAFLAENGFA